MSAGFLGRMSIRSLVKAVELTKQKASSVQVFLRYFSRRNSNVEHTYKPVKSRRSNKTASGLIWKDPNFELFAPSNDFPFFLPGHVGLAWFDKQTTIQTHQEFIMEQVDDERIFDRNIMCSVQECPTVLRKSVSDLFPYHNLESCNLSVVTISLKLDYRLMKKNKEHETERMAQSFVIAAKSVCDKLRKAGYWADFINPFSGKPYLAPASIDTNKLYTADEKFRCLDFQIFEIQDCKVISNEQEGARKRFTGSLFTNASKKHGFSDIFSAENV